MKYITIMQRNNVEIVRFSELTFRRRIDSLGVDSMFMLNNLVQHPFMHEKKARAKIFTIRTSDFTVHEFIVYKKNGMIDVKKDWWEK